MLQLSDAHHQICVLQARHLPLLTEVHGEPADPITDAPYQLGALQ